MSNRNAAFIENVQDHPPFDLSGFDTTLARPFDSKHTDGFG
ncbi:hypothetical protein D3OALGA1CA_1334 [Olavius algarvensis associated proteobacterium Delta 3]|nr:hypothetical protein D3OALGA1CA_1334 [Olavius algarvensis associated proteobacterium Delta 3]CAB5124650.1 hypothetical protein D3OALGB2SA_3203 [Olavius algarvensis associated proteobacterium Delta 3]